MDTDLAAIQEVRDRCETAAQAAEELRRCPQAELDAIVEAMARAAYQAAESLARAAIEDTGFGKLEDNTLKNVFASWYVYRYIRNMKTTGVIRERADDKILEIAEPVGVIAAILPTTNPTSTAINKALIALKAGNSIIMSPHPRAARCVAETVQVLHDAAVGAGAPHGCIQTLDHPTLAATDALMRHRHVALILATGGPAMVRAAYSAGKPAYGVGPGNVPVIIDKSARVGKAVSDILLSKTFDNGTLCTSEQALIVEDSHKEPVIRELIRQRVYFAEPDEQEKLARLIVRNDAINPAIVGQSPGKLAEMAGFNLPDDTTVIMVTLKGVGRDHPLSIEKLSPVLAFYVEPDIAACIRRAVAVLNYGGLGHTAAIHAADDAVVRDFAAAVPAYRVIVNSPADHGGVGITTALTPSMSLGSGTISGSITTEHLNPMLLVNIKRIAWEKHPVATVPMKQAGENFDALPGAPSAGSSTAHRAGVRSTRYTGYKKWDDPPIRKVRSVTGYGGARS